MPERAHPQVIGTAEPPESSLIDVIGAAILAEGEGRASLDPADPADHLRIVARSAEADRAGRELLGQSITAARAHGHSWAAIGRVLGLSRQAAQQRFGERRVADHDPGGSPLTPEEAERRTLGPVTAFDELHELALAGERGWHTVGVGMFTHTMVRTPTRWEHRRVVWAGPLGRYTRDGWQVGAKAFPWLYLIRDTGERV